MGEVSLIVVAGRQCDLQERERARPGEQPQRRLKALDAGIEARRQAEVLAEQPIHRADRVPGLRAHLLDIHLAGRDLPRQVQRELVRLG